MNRSFSGIDRFVTRNFICRAVRASLLFAASGMAVLLSGCRPQQDPFLDLVDSQLGTRQVSDLERTMGLAASDASYDNRQYEEDISGGLNRWINRVVEDGGAGADDSQRWKPDTLAEPLVVQYRDIPTVAAFSDRQFVSTDPYYIRGRSWMKTIARRICDFHSLIHLELYRLQAGDYQPAEGDLAPVASLVAKLHPELEPAAASQLGEALVLFDWTVRNIQLELPGPTSETDIANLRLVDSDGGSPASQGVPGLGYRRFVWQVLLYGRGDHVEKARLFAGLCGQRGIETVMLYCGDEPWAVAALIGGQAWLFDPRLGLPVPGTGPGRIATLADVQKDPGLLAALDLTVEESNRDDSRYWIRSDGLASLRGEIFASPESLSRRMRFLEDRLIGDQRLVLADDPVATIAAVHAVIPGLAVTLSRVEFDTHLFRKVVGEAQQRVSFDEEIASRLGWYFLDEAYIDQFVDYRSARNVFFVGRFSTERNSRRVSAVQGFYSLFYSDEAIGGIGSDTITLNRLGIRKGADQSAAEFEREIQAVQRNMGLVRRDVGVFLAQSHFDHGNVSSCGNWLMRLQQRDDTSRWMPVMKYLEGRSAEAIRDYPAALVAFRAADGAQYIGNILRARLLETAVKAAGFPLVHQSAEPPAADAGEAAPAAADPPGSPDVDEGDRPAEGDGQSP